MSEEQFDEVDIIKRKLQNFLNVKLKVEDYSDVVISEQEKQAFIKMINKIEALLKSEEKFYKQTGVNLGSITANYWGTMSAMLEFSFGSEPTEVIEWYLFERNKKNPAWEDQDGQSYILKGASDLYEFLAHKFYWEA